MGYNKYHAHKIHADGRTFDSRKEFNRYRELTILEAAGRIKDLRCQVPFELIPAQREPDREGPRGENAPERSLSGLVDISPILSICKTVSI